MTLFEIFGALAMAVAALLPMPAFADSGYVDGATGYDISYPQCESALPGEHFEIAIIGVNGGKSFTENPCFARQIQWAKDGSSAPAVYINTNSAPQQYNNYEYGREAAAHAVDYANANGAADIARYWLDVETMNAWSPNTSLNAEALRGYIDGVRAKGKTVMGVYSTSYQWGHITGGWAPQGGLDNWVPVPDLQDWPADAAAACRTTPSFAGGSVVMLQWWRTYDENYACPPQV